MLKTKLSLDVLATELKELPTEKQFRIKGGSVGSPIVLPPVSIHDTPINDEEPDPGDDPNNNDPSDSLGGSGGSSYDNPDGDTNTINDPNGVVANMENQMNSYKTVLEGILASGQVPPGSGLTLEGVQNYLDSVNHVLDIIDRMETSDKAYRIEEGEVEGSSTGQTYYDVSSGEYVIRLEDINGDVGTLAHELLHCEQIENGDVSFDAEGNIIGLSLDDEVEAFQLQHDMNYGARAEYVDLWGNAVPEGGYEVTAEDVLERFPEYADLPLHDDEGDAGGGSSSSAG